MNVAITDWTKSEIFKDVTYFDLFLSYLVLEVEKEVGLNLD